MEDNILDQPYKVLWLHTSGNDHYAGTIKINNVVGHSGLHIVLSPMVRIEHLGQPPEWLPVKPRLNRYEFDFKVSRIEKNGDNKVKVITLEGDEVTLSNEVADEEEVNRLVA